MKTTNFEISKKLKEAGFEAQSSFFWCELGKDLIKIHISQSHSVPESLDKIKAYDLETLIDALPDSITREYKSTEDGTIKEFEEKLLINKSEIWYKCYDIETSDDANEYGREYGYVQNISIYSWDDSLANIAGKMLIELFEAGIINFNK
jgi:hypothetical protein